MEVLFGLSKHDRGKFMESIIRLAFLVPIVVLGVADTCIPQEPLQVFATFLVLLL